MRGFRYKFGDRPLDGYTIQRGIGRGGFGEVYYALSDSGKEVALKVIQGFEQVELRGVGHCMNLKSQHLVTIFDVKHGEDGTPFVIMEYVSGPTLRQLLDESPGGLGGQKTAYFLREIGKGLSVLHECGIVHRDLKPGNIFFENGVVKIGDYGLSKAMTASQHSGQTVTVGTVHYMAPEIGAGKYDQGIDIYALGAVIFELLTGNVPFVGASPTEILMKHISAEPDVSRIEEPFASVIKRCMAKDPGKRFANVQEVVEAVFGAEQVRESVSVFSPQSLSMVAQRAADRVAAGGGSASPAPRSAVGVAEAEDVWGRLGRRFDRAGEKISKLGDRLAGVMDRPGFGEMDALERPDQLKAHHRIMLSLIVLTLLTIAAGVISTEDSGPVRAFANLLWTVGATAALLIVGRKLTPLLAKESLGLRRLACGGAGMVGLLAIGFVIFPAANGREAQALGMTMLAIMAPIFLVNWLALSDPMRAERLMFRPVIVAAAIGLGLSIPMGGYPALAASIMAGTAMLVQILSPWRRTETMRPAPGVSWFGDQPPVMPSPVPPPPLPSALSEPLGTDQKAAAMAVSTMRQGPAQWPYAFAAVSGWVVLLVSVIICCAMALNIVGMAMVQDERRGGNWNGPSSSLVWLIGTIIGSAGLFLSLILFLLARRRSGVMHILRGLVGVSAVAGSCAIAYMAIRKTPLSEAQIMPAEAPLWVLDGYLRSIDEAMIMGAGFMLLGGLALLVWPVSGKRLANLGLRVPRPWISGSIVGWLVLMVSLLVGISMAVDIPGMSMLSIETRSETWNGPPSLLLRVIGTFIAGAGMCVAMLLLAAGRRGKGILHLLRLIAGIGGVAISCGVAYAGFESHHSLIGLARMNAGRSPSQVLDIYVRGFGMGALIGAGFILMAALTLLIWPASARSTALVGEVKP